MRANVGIRRRLAPLVGHSPDAQLLLTSLLLSLPGTPILYNGDEIGMGDDIWLEDRDAVRTPMQSTAAPHGGLSDAPLDRFHLPISRSPVHGPGACSVETQMDVPTSLLRRTRATVLARRTHPALSNGRYVELSRENHAVLAFLRILDDDIVLCVNNFSARAQPVAVNLGGWGSLIPVELGSGAAFPVAEGQALLLSLGAHDVLWFGLYRAKVPATHRVSTSVV